MVALYGLHTEAKRCIGRNPGATRILLIARSFACSVLVEADHACDMVQDLGRNRLAIQNTCHDRIRHGCLELVRVVATVEVSRGTLVEPMDELAQIAAAKPALLPQLERFSDRQERRNSSSCAAAAHSRRRRFTRFGMSAMPKLDGHRASTQHPSSWILGCGRSRLHA